jgi:predicted dehydrogenase
VWRTDPRRSGAGGCIGDIGTHAAHLARYVTGLRFDALCADLTSFVKGRRLDDDASVLLRFEGGAKGVLQCSQISVGDDNDLRIRVYGEKGSLEWHQEHPEELAVKYADAPREIFRRGAGYASSAAARVVRVPAGHPEGYIEAFANLYREAFRAIRAEVAGEPIPPDCDFPTIDDGVDGMRFVAAAVESSRLDSRWVKV